ncbi:MAG: hypothetical protein U1E28_14495 [Beijerinckiaceae bacterium]
MRERESDLRALSQNAQKSKAFKADFDFSTVVARDLFDRNAGVRAHPFSGKFATVSVIARRVFVDVERIGSMVLQGVA